MPTICSYCLEEREPSPACATCRGGEFPASSPAALPCGTWLRGDGESCSRYLLGRTLGCGGFGIVYLGRQAQLGQIVAIKELYPSTHVVRVDDGTVVARSHGDAAPFESLRRRFVKEAQTLGRLPPNERCVRVLDIVEANGTAYLVTEFVRGESLRDHRLRRGGRLDVGRVLFLGREVALALAHIHQHNLVHRDIAPDNVMLTEQDKVVVIDFGAARFVAEGGASRLSGVTKVGFSPPEQMVEPDESNLLRQGPWTDIYAFGGTLYELLTGNRPPNALTRTLTGATRLRPELNPSQARHPDAKALCDLIEHCLQLAIDARPHSAAHLFDGLRPPPPTPPAAAGSRVSQRCTFCFEPRDPDSNCAGCRDIEWPAQDPDALRPGTRIGNPTYSTGTYVLGRMLGKGAYGIVYVAWDESDQRRVAVKEIFPREWVGRSADGRMIMQYDRSTLEARREARSFLDRTRLDALALARLKSGPHVALVRKVFEANDTVYLVREFAEGTSLERYCEQSGGHVDLETAVALARDVATALSHLHQNGALHLDLAPNNVIVDAKGRATVIDVDVVRPALEAIRFSRVFRRHSYWAPEIAFWAPEIVGPWSDVYALGAIVYEVLSGCPPAASDARVTCPSDPLVPLRDLVACPTTEVAQLVSAVSDALHLDPGRRPRDGADFLARLGWSPSLPQADRDATRPLAPGRRISGEYTIAPGDLDGPVGHREPGRRDSAPSPAAVARQRASGGPSSQALPRRDSDGSSPRPPANPIGSIIMAGVSGLSLFLYYLVIGNVVPWTVCAILVSLTALVAHLREGADGMGTVALTLVAVAGSGAAAGQISCAPMWNVQTAVVLSAWTLPLSMLAWLLLRTNPLLVGIGGGLLAVGMMFAGISEGVADYNLTNLSDWAIADWQIWTLLVLVHVGPVALVASMLGKGLLFAASDPSDSQNFGGPRDHSGEPIAPGHRHLPEPPNDIGSIISVESALLEGAVPWSVTKRLLASAAVALVAGLLGYWVDPCVRGGENAVPVVAVLGAGLGVASFWMLFGKEYCTYVGTLGCSVGVFEPIDGNIGVRYRTLRFSEAEHLFSKSVSYYNMVVSNLTHESDEHDFDWVDGEGTSLFALQGKSTHNVCGNPKRHAFAKAAAMAWTKYLVSKHIEAPAEQRREVRFPARLGRGTIVVNGERVQWVPPDAESPVADVVRMSFDDGLLVLDVVGQKGREKPIQVPTGAVANLALLVALAQKCFKE